MQKSSWIVVAIAIALGIPSAHAQRLSYGPKAGINFSAISQLDKFQTPKQRKKGKQEGLFDVLRTSFHTGAYLEYRPIPKLSIGTELVYSRVGFVHKKYALKLSYTSIPHWIMFYPFGHSAGTGVYLGPPFDFLWQATPVRLKLLQERHMSTLALSAIAGIQYTFAWGLRIDLRYNWGLTDIFDFQAPAQRPFQIAGLQLANHWLQLSLGYNLGAVMFQQKAREIRSPLRRTMYCYRSNGGY